jgi:CheY-like chemotaxis protein/two-component sensor histidine kinase
MAESERALGSTDSYSGPERRTIDAERALKARSEFLSILSHQLRNPIQAIHTNALLIKSRAKDVEVTRPAEAIDRQVDRLTKILDDLLDAIKVAQGEELAFHTVSLQQVVGAAVETARRAMDAHRRDVTVDMPEGALHINADPARLQKAIGNVLNNAVKYSSQQGEIVVTVARENGHALVSVKDQGSGIPPEVLPHVFSYFTHGRAGRRDVNAGLGIGLHISREVVSAHGGTIEAKSAGAGKGAEFVIRLPLTAEVPAKDASHRTPYEEKQALRILVVDDNRDAADSLATLLEVYGHTGLVAYDGETALDKAEKMRPHVALVDIGMPSMNGFEVARRIKDAPWGKDTLLVAVTGWGAKSDRARSKEAGFAYHLTKPVDYDTLASLLSTAVRKPGTKG